MTLIVPDNPIRTGAGDYLRCRLRRGFTMVELLIVIGLIVLLVGLTATVGLGLMSKSQISETENVLRLLDLAVSEWESLSERKPSWGDSSQGQFDMLNGAAHVFTTTELLRTVNRPSQVKTIIAQINQNFLHTYNSAEDLPPWLPPNVDPFDPDPYLLSGNPRDEVAAGAWDGTLAVLDAWGTPIRAINPGRLAAVVYGDNPADIRSDSNPTGTVNLDGTVFIDTTNHNGVMFYGVEQFYGVAVNRRVCFVSAGPDGKFGNLSEVAGNPAFEATRDNIYSYPVEDPTP